MSWKTDIWKGNLPNNFLNKKEKKNQLKLHQWQVRCGIDTCLCCGLTKSLTTSEFKLLNISKYVYLLPIAGSWLLRPCDWRKRQAVFYCNSNCSNCWRYGTDFVENWNFETWNEPDHRDFCGIKFDLESFLTYFDISISALKSGRNKLKVFWLSNFPGNYSSNYSLEAQLDHADILISSSTALDC